MMLRRNPSGGVAAVSQGQGNAVAPQQTDALERRLVALEMEHARLVEAFKRLVQRLAQRAQVAQQQVTPTGARIPQVVIEQGQRGQGTQAQGPGSQARADDDFDREIEEAIRDSGGDDDENPFA